MRRAALRSVVPYLAGGLVLLAFGAWAAHGVLPAWQFEGVVSRQELVDRYRQLAQQAGVTLVTGEPSLSLASRDDLDDPRADEAVYVPDEGSWAVLVRVAGEVSGEGREAELVLGFSPAGDPLSFSWTPLSAASLLSEVQLGSGFQEEVESFARLLVPPGRELGEKSTLAGLGAVTVLFPLTGDPPAHVEVYDLVGGAFLGFLRSAPAAESERSGAVFDLTRQLLSKIPGILAFLVVAGLFLAFLGRRRIDLINGACLASLTFLVLLASTLPWNRGLLHFLESFFSALTPSLWVLLLWSTGESWLRSLDLDFSTALDALRVGRLGPRGGRALLAGLGLGAGLAGFALLLAAGVELTNLLGRTGLLVPLPIFSGHGDPLARGALLASTLVLVAALCLRFLPRRLALGLAALVVAALIRPLPVAPLPLTVIAGAVVTGGLVFALQRFELTGLLTAGIALHTLPAVLVSGQLLDWTPGSFALTAGLVLALGSAGFVGLGREGEEEARGMTVPAFVRRLEDEKRLQHEMGLLARMQLGLLPEDVPRMDGWEISARSVLAAEVGGDLYDFLEDRRERLWIAVGDVSGHGYSCAIVHAMTKAALASLVAADRSPGEVLAEVDRVLRTVRYRRAFTSMTLMRLDPRSGEGLLANAGHPYPLLFTDGRVGELELPGLPLGQGPARSYPDRPVRLDPGSVLVFCSDGLFEATDREVRAYGFERPKQLLTKAARWPSNEVLEMLLADWRRHRGTTASVDDTTVVVIKRLTTEEEAL